MHLNIGIISSGSLDNVALVTGSFFNILCIGVMFTFKNSDRQGAVTVIFSGSKWSEISVGAAGLINILSNKVSYTIIFYDGD